MTRSGPAKRWITLALLSPSILMLLAVPARGSTTVLKDGNVGCFTDPGDIPGMPGFALPKGTLVLRGNGGVTVSCHGWLPDGLTVDGTSAGTAPCRAPTGEVVEAHVVATISGRVHFICRFPAGTF